MVFELAAIAGKQWPYKALDRLGDINQRALDRVTEFQVDLIKHNLDALLELSAKNITLWMDSSDDVLSVFDGFYKSSTKGPETVTQKKKVAKNKGKGTAKRNGLKKKAAGRRPSTRK